MKLRKEINDKVVEAIEKSPLSAYYKGRITYEERLEIERRGLKVDTQSIYMDGSGEYYITYRG